MPELLNRAVQVVLGSLLFELGPLRHLRYWAYRRMFRMGQGNVVGHSVMIGRPHKPDGGPLKIGAHVRILSDVLLDYSGGVTLEDYVKISPGSKVYTHAHSVTTRALKDTQPILFSPLYVGRDAWIGGNVIVMASVTRIGEGAVIGGGSVLTKEVGDWEIWAGNPARKIGERRDPIEVDE
jgi:acetyltransferase-like isoleucine patch superfamily enzyme